MKKKKIKKIQIARKGVQLLGFGLTIAAFFTSLPIAMTLLIGITFLAGPVFCGWVCPYGFLQDLFSKLGKLLGIKKRKMPAPIQKVLVFSRYILLGFVLLVSTDLIFTIMSADPRANFTTSLLGSAVSVSGMFIVLVFLAISLFFERPFCNYLCVEGAKYGIYSALRPITVKRNENSCVNCGKCDKACPMNIEVSGYTQVRSLQCINCYECVESCPVKNTLTIGVIPLDKKIGKVLLPIMMTFGLLFFTYVSANNNDLVLPTFVTEAFSTTTSDAMSEEVTVVEQALATLETTTQDETTDSTSNVATTDNATSSATTTDNATASSANDNTAAASSTTSDSTTTASSTTDTTTTTDKQTTTATAEQTPAASSTTTNNNTTAASSTATTTTDTASATTGTTATTDTTTTDTQVITGSTAANLGDAAGIPDGVYTGSGQGFRGNTVVQVTIVDQMITDVVVTETRDDAKWFNRAYSGMVSRIIEAQSADVDTVSGATYSSIGIRDAVAAALASAK